MRHLPASKARLKSATYVPVISIYGYVGRYTDLSLIDMGARVGVTIYFWINR